MVILLNVYMIARLSLVFIPLRTAVNWSNTSNEEFIEKGIVENGFVILPIEPEHTAVLTTLPFYHRDSFDRLIIAQAMVEGIAVEGPGLPPADATHSFCPRRRRRMLRAWGFPKTPWTVECGRKPGK